MTVQRPLDKKGRTTSPAMRREHELSDPRLSLGSRHPVGRSEVPNLSTTGRWTVAGSAGVLERDLFDDSRALGRQVSVRPDDFKGLAVGFSV